MSEAVDVELEDEDGARPGLRVGLCVMAKLPIAGLVNTRMQPELSGEGAARLQRLLLTDLLTREFESVHERHLFLARSEDSAARHASTEKTASSATDVRDWLDPWSELASVRREHGWRVHPQQGDDLGTRMQNAARAVLASCDVVVILGTDAPGLPQRSIQDAIQSAREGDAAVIPSSDGGYVAVASTNAGLPILSRDIPWGTDGVMEKTLSVAARLGLRVTTSEPWFDVDTVADIERELVQCSDARKGTLYLTAPRTMKFVNECFAK